MFYYFMKILAFIPFWLFCPTFIKGKKNIPKGKCVFVINHRSNFDALLLLNMIWRRQYVLCKKEAFRHWPARIILKGMGVIPVDRQKFELSTLKQCFSVLKDNKILTIFPEGTRNRTISDLLELKDGAGTIAQKTNSPIIPIWIKKKQKPFCFNTIYVGEPFYLSKSDQNSNEIIRQKMLELKK